MMKIALVVVAAGVLTTPRSCSNLKLPRHTSTLPKGDLAARLRHVRSTP